MKIIATFIFFLMFALLAGCQKENLSPHTSSWINDTAEEALIYSNDNGEKKAVHVSYVREMGDTPNPFKKTEAASIVYKTNNIESLELHFSTLDHISFEGRYCTDSNGPWLGSGHSALAIYPGKAALVVEGNEHLVIVDNYAIRGRIYNQLAIFNAIPAANPLTIEKYFYSKHEGLVAILDTNDEMWVR